MRLGWYSRLCLVLTLWWLAIGTVWTVSKDDDRAMAFDQLIYRNCEATADRYAASGDGQRAMAESKRCMDDMEASGKRRAADIGAEWINAFGFAAMFAAFGLLLALAGYWSARFILAGRQK